MKFEDGIYHVRCMAWVAVMLHVFQVYSLVDCDTHLFAGSHAAYVLEERMAKTPATVATFLSGLSDALRPLADADLASLLSRKQVRWWYPFATCAWSFCHPTLINACSGRGGPRQWTNYYGRLPVGPLLCSRGQSFARCDIVPPQVLHGGRATGSL